jgi:hypothetical protein
MLHLHMEQVEKANEGLSRAGDGMDGRGEQEEAESKEGLRSGDDQPVRSHGKDGNGDQDKEHAGDEALQQLKPAEQVDCAGAGRKRPADATPCALASSQTSCKKFVTASSLSAQQAEQNIDMIPQGRDTSECLFSTLKTRAPCEFEFAVTGFRTGKVHRMLAPGTCTLLSLVKHAFKYFLRNELGEGINAHCWYLYHEKVRFAGDQRTFELDRYCGACEEPTLSTCADQILGDLRLEAKDCLRLEYDFGNTRIVHFQIVQVSPADEVSAGGPGFAYLGTKERRIPKDGALITSEEAVENAAFKKKYNAYMEGDNLWSWKQGCFIPPVAPPWSRAEMQVLSCLIESGMGFSKAWKELMEPCLLLRTKTSASGMWYKTKKSCFIIGRNASSSIETARGILIFCREEALRFQSRCKKDKPLLNGAHRDAVFYQMWTIRPEGLAEYQHAKDEAQKRFLRIPADQQVSLYSMFWSDARREFQKEYDCDPEGASEVCKLRDFVNGLGPQVPDFGRLSLLSLWLSRPQKGWVSGSHGLEP